MSNQENQHLEPWVDLVKTSHERLRASAARFLPSVESITQAGAWPRLLTDELFKASAVVCASRARAAGVVRSPSPW